MTNLTHRLISLLQFAIVIILIIIGIYEIFRNYGGIKYSRDFEAFYNKLEGEDPAYAQEALDAAHAEPLNRRDAEYYYRLGVITQHNLNDPKGAEKYFVKALEMLNNLEQKVVNNDYIFLTDRIADNARAARNPVLHNNAIQIQADGVRNQIIGINDPNLIREQIALFADRQNIHPNNTSAFANAIENVKTFKSDSQNVHDSTLNSDLALQFKKIKNYNQLEGLKINVEGFKPRTKDPEKNKRINNVLNVIKSNASVTSLIGGTEYQLLEAVYNRIYSSQNINNREKLLEALTDQLNECATSDTSTVCVAGRCGHVLSSLAILDNDPELGILKTKEVIRNSLLNDAAHIVERYTGEDSTVNKQTLDDFNKGNDTNDVKNLKLNMANEIKMLGDKYEGQLPDDQKKLLIQQSLAVIQ